MDWRAKVRSALPASGDPDRDDDVREELAQHCADRYAELRRAGTPPDDAERIVGAEILEMARAAPRLTGAGAPAAAWRPGRVAAAVAHDVRYALRLMRQAPGFAASAALTLALAVGAVTAIFSVLDGVVIRPLPYPEPDRLVFVWEVSPRGEDHNVVSPGNYLAWRDRVRGFAALGALGLPTHAAFTGGGEPVRVTLAFVAPSALDVLRVVPREGRLFADGDDAAGAPRLALLGHAFWLRRFGGDPAAVGREITVDGLAFTVRGVLPPDGTLPQLDADVVVPLRFSAEDREEFRSHNYRVIGRLRPGVTREEAQVEMASHVASLAAEYPAELAGWGVNVVGLHGDLVRSVRPMLILLMTVVVAVLLIACANLANLQMARALGRGGEMAVRAAIGAGRGRLAGQLAAESFTLAAIGGALGVLLAWWLTRVLVAIAPSDIPLLNHVTFDRRALAIALATTAGSAWMVGVLPVVQFLRADLQPFLHGARIYSDRRQGRLRLGLVAAQVALALVLLLAATLLTRSFLNLRAVDHGFDPAQVLTVNLDLPGARYADAEARAGFYRELLTRVRAMPGVGAVASTSAFAGEGAGMTFSFAIEGRPSANPTGREDPVPLQAVSPGYFETMRIPVLEGRSLAATDDVRGMPVVVINRALARLHWGEESPLGRRLSARPGQTPWLEVVGLVGDTHDEGLDQPAPPTLYLPYDQAVATWGWMSWQNLVVRAADDPAAVARPIAAAVWDLDDQLPLLEVGTMASAFAENAARRRFAMQMLAGAAGIALLLGAVGLYGVLSRGVSERRQEIGVRLALGARPGQVAVSIVRPVVVMALVGVGIGLAMAGVAARLLETFLFGVEPIDPASFAVVAVLLVAVSAAASWRPLRRAARLDPAAVLRES
jgi:putative ABC transport system permease protein